MQRVLDFLSKSPIFYFATTDKYRPRVRPFSFYMFFNGRLYFGMDKQKDCYSQLLKNPNIEICCCSGDGNAWMRIGAVAQFDNSPEALSAAFAQAPYFRDMFNDSSKSKLGLVYIQHGEASINDFNSNSEVIEKF